MNYWQTIIYHCILLFESVTNIILSLFALANKVNIMWSMNWLCYTSVLRYNKECKKSLLVREIKEEEARKLEQMAFKLDSNGQDVS